MVEVVFMYLGRLMVTDNTDTQAICDNLAKARKPIKWTWGGKKRIPLLLYPRTRLRWSLRSVSISVQRTHQLSSAF
eukprot:scaffold3256_cov120-Skeletonema_menzelii.AAC.3